MTTSNLGLSFLILTMNLSIYSILGSIIGIKLNNIQIKQSSKNAAYCTFITTLISSICLVYAFVTNDFSRGFFIRYSAHSQAPRASGAYYMAQTNPKMEGQSSY